LLSWSTLAKAVFRNGKITMFFSHYVIILFLILCLSSTYMWHSSKALSFFICSFAIIVNSSSSSVLILVIFLFAGCWSYSNKFHVTHTHDSHCRQWDADLFGLCQPCSNFLVRIVFGIKLLGLKFFVCIWQDRFLLSG
jgi:hypothetical protein